MYRYVETDMNNISLRENMSLNVVSESRSNSTTAMGDDDRQIKYIKVGMEFTQTVTNRILENLDGAEKEEHLQSMRRVMMDYVKMESEYNCSKDVLAKLKKGLEAENADMNRDVEKEYRERLKEQMASKWSAR